MASTITMSLRSSRVSGLSSSAIGRGRHKAVLLQDDALGSERSHVQPHRGGAGATIEGESQRTLARILAVKRVGDEKHLGFDLAVGALQGKPAGGRRVVQTSCR